MQLGPAVKRYLDVRLAEGAARESIRKELTTLRAALREAVALGWMTKAQSIDAIPDFTARYKPRTRWLKRDEYAKLLDALEMVELPAGKSKRAQKLVKPSPRLGLRVVNQRLWVAIAVGLGVRHSEVESLDWSGIDLDAGILANHGTKTKGSDRATPIPVELLAELRKILIGELTRGVVRWLMAAHASGAPSAEAPTVEALIEALDPEVRAAIDDVDRTLIALSLQQSPWDRLRSASRMAQTLARIRDAMASQGG